jgi:acyl-coenzyme A thioesterase PaaI-like protein
LTATAREVSRTKRTGVYEVTVTDDANAVIAIMTGTAYIKEI